VTLPAPFRSCLPDTPIFDALAGADARQVLERERRHLTRLTEYAPGQVQIGV
jgi:hypothetical protein